jgi:hypothetical protein
MGEIDQPKSVPVLLSQRSTPSLQKSSNFANVSSNFLKNSGSQKKLIIFIPMLKKRIAILFLLIAQIIVLGHDIVPHHHHTDLVSQQHHHHDEDGKDQHSDENSLQLAFSGFIHAGEQVTLTYSAGEKIVVTKQALKVMDALPCGFIMPVAYIINCQKHTFPPDRQIIYQSPFYGSYSLRGPPVFIIA